MNSPRFPGEHLPRWAGLRTAVGAPWIPDVAGYTTSMLLLRFLLVLCPVSATQLAAPTQDPVPVISPKPARALVPGTRVTLTPPADHEPGRGFLGYQWPEFATSLIVIEMPGPFAEVARGMDEAGLAKGGMKLIEASDTKIAERDARLLFVSQTMQGTSYRKWIAVFGDEKRTVLLNAVFPEEIEAEMSTSMKAALLGAEWNPKLVIDPFAPLPWTLEHPEGLRFAGNLGTSLVFTQDGEFVQKDKPGSARFSVSPSMGSAKIADPRKFAESRARALPSGREFVFESSVAHERGNQKGWEILAKWRDKGAELDILVHQIILIREDEYFIFVGQCLESERELWIGRFRAAVSSWRPRVDAR